MRLAFRSRRLREVFPAGVVTSFIAGFVIAPRLVGSGPSELLLGGIAIGLAGAVALYLLLKFVAEPRIISRRQWR
jgi:hypothetical protein